jgi:hypothetical protein
LFHWYPLRFAIESEAANLVPARAVWPPFKVFRVSKAQVLFRPVKCFDMNTAEQTVVGVGFRYAIPGEGLIFLDAGRVILSSDGSIAFSAGPKDALTGFGQLLQCTRVISETTIIVEPEPPEVLLWTRAKLRFRFEL